MHTSDTHASPARLDAATLAALSALTLWAVRELSLACDSYALAGLDGEAVAGGIPWRTPARAALVASVARARRAREAWVSAPASAEAVEAVRVALAALTTDATRAAGELIGAEHRDDALPVPPRVMSAALAADAAARALGARRPSTRSALTLRAVAAVEAWGPAPVSPATLATLRAGALGGAEVCA